MKRVLITGASGAIGAAIAKVFLKDYEVVGTYNSDNTSASELEKSGVRMVQCDISDRNSVEALLKQVERCDVLINNAGISQIKLFTDTTYDEWDKMLAVNLTGAVNVTKAFLPQMIARKSGAVINISSVWGVYGASCEVAYSTAKAGLIGFTKALAKEVGLSGITVNAIAPGVIDSKMNGHLSADEMQELCDETPLGRIGKASDVAQAALYLAQADFVTGQVLGVDGGFY